MNSTIKLVSNRYGKSRVRLMRVVRHEGVHDLFDWNVQILLTGDYDSAHVEGDNSKLLTTDAMKNTVYSRARESTARTIEHFAIELAEFLLERHPQIDSAEVTIESSMWKRMYVDGALHPSTFLHGSDEVQTAVIRLTREHAGEQSAGADGSTSLRISSGLDRLLVLKTSDSAFEGFLKDSLTTLKETQDRLMGTVVKASWRYAAPHAGLDFEALRTGIREVMLKTFTQHRSKSVQHTLYAMGEAALNAEAAIDQVDLLMPNKHCLLVDLSRFGQDNPNEIFVPTDEPHGTIEACLRRQV